MSGRRPRLCLFPYTTLFRSDEGVTFSFCVEVHVAVEAEVRIGSAVCECRIASIRHSFGIKDGLDTLLGSRPARSEEHTSELQSLRHLVCRLLLETKQHNRQQ